MKYGVKPKGKPEESEDEVDSDRLEIEEEPKEEEVMPQRKRRLLKKSDPELADTVGLPDSQPRSATGSDPDLGVVAL